MRLLFICTSATLLLSTAFGSTEQLLLDWVKSRGGQVHFIVGRPCASCERGALAARSFARGEVVAKVPANSTISLGPGSSAEQAYRLLEQLRQDEAFENTFSLYVESLPSPEELFTPEMYSNEELRELQTPELERLIRSKRHRVEKLYEEKGGGPAGLSLQELKHMTALVSTRNFVLLGSQRLVPALDMVNHSEDPNIEFTDDGSEFVLFIATRHIALGEELTASYMGSSLQRSDAALFLYGFLPKEREQQLLCTVDLPTYNPWNPWRRTDEADPEVRPGAPSLVQRWEHSRLAALLAEMATSERRDVELLEGGRLEGWQRRMLVQFRLQRKRALRLALERLEKAWAAHQAARTAQSCRQPEQARLKGPFDACAGQRAEALHSLLQCPSGGWGMPRRLSEVAAATYFTARAWMYIALPTLLFAVAVYSLVPAFYALCICVAVVAVVISTA